MTNVQLSAGTGISSLDAARAAGRDAATQALVGLHGEQPALIMVYASPHYDWASSSQAESC